MDVDKSGARALTGGEDYKLKMFDFGGMKRDMRAFRTLEPEDSYPVNAISFSPTGVCTACVTWYHLCADSRSGGAGEGGM